MKKLNWSKFNKRIPIKSDKGKIFDAWLSQESLERWFLSKAQFYSKDAVEKDRFSRVEKGDKYEWMWHGSDNIATGEILENNGVNFIKFTFLGCVVTVDIHSENGESIVELIQSEIPLDEVSRMNYYVGCSRGWTFFLTNLKSILEGGIDLRNRNKELKDVINT